MRERILPVMGGSRLSSAQRVALHIAGSTAHLECVVIGEVIAAILLFLVASAIMSGAKWARVAVAIVLGIRLAFATYWMIVHIGGGLQWNAIVSAGIAIFVLWALYGNKTRRNTSRERRKPQTESHQQPEGVCCGRPPFVVPVTCGSPCVLSATTVHRSSPTCTRLSVNCDL